MYLLVVLKTHLLHHFLFFFFRCSLPQPSPLFLLWRFFLFSHRCLCRCCYCSYCFLPFVTGFLGRSAVLGHVSWFPTIVAFEGSPFSVDVHCVWISGGLSCSGSQCDGHGFTVARFRLGSMVVPASAISEGFLRISVTSC
jgi:hypothetical protein